MEGGGVENKWIHAPPYPLISPLGVFVWRNIGVKRDGWKDGRKIENEIMRELIKNNGLIEIQEKVDERL